MRLLVPPQMQCASLCLLECNVTPYALETLPPPPPLDSLLSFEGFELANLGPTAHSRPWPSCLVRGRDALPLLEVMVKDAGSRSALVQAGAASALASLLGGLLLPGQSHDDEGVTAVLGTLSALSCHEGDARKQALQAVPHIVSCLSSSPTASDAIAVAALKAMVNFTQVPPIPAPLLHRQSPSVTQCTSQGDTKDHPLLLEAVPCLIAVAGQQGNAQGRDLGRAAYAAMCLTNLASGSDALKMHLVARPSSFHISHWTHHHTTPSCIGLERRG